MIDIFVLFVLHSITAHKKTVEKIFCDKIKAGYLSDDLMNSVFDSHPLVSVELVSELSFCRAIPLLKLNPFNQDTLQSQEVMPPL